MNSRANDKHTQIYQIVSVVKWASLVLGAIIFIRYVFNLDEGRSQVDKYYLVIPVLSIMFLLALFYGMSTVYSRKRVDHKWGKWVHVIEHIVLFSIFTFLIYISGAQNSECKYIFLFLIITTTIQYGTRQGMLTACMASIIILVMDLIFAKGPIFSTYFENDLILSGVFILTAWPLGYYVKIERDHIRELEEQVNRDGLTGVYNHRFFCENLTQCIQEAQKEKAYVSMIFIDIDYFKKYNDLYGHQKGDEVLKRVGTLISECVGSTGIVARYGGGRICGYFTRY